MFAWSDIEVEGSAQPAPNNAVVDPGQAWACGKGEDPSCKRSNAGELGPKHPQLLASNSSSGCKKSTAGKAAPSFDVLRRNESESNRAKSVTSKENTGPRRVDPRTGTSSSRHVESCVEGDAPGLRGSGTSREGPKQLELCGSGTGPGWAESGTGAMTSERAWLRGGTNKSICVHSETNERSPGRQSPDTDVKEATRLQLRGRSEKLV